MNYPKSPLSIFSVTIIAAISSHAAPLVLPAGTYTETFNGMVAGNNPVPGWNATQDATETALGTTISTSATLRGWTHNSGQMKNVSSTNIPSTSTSAEQAANPDRAFGFNQANTFGDPGVSINFNFSTTGLTVQSMNFDLLMLTVVSGRATTMSIQYGVGAAPGSFVTLGTWSDPEVWGATGFSFDRDDFGAALDGQSSVWFRFAALTASSGSTNIRDQIAIDNFSISTTAVPEPSTYALLGLGTLGAIIALHRRRVARN